MKRISLITIALLLFGSRSIYAQTAGLNGFCQKGATPAITSGLPSSNTLQGVVPGGPAGCLVTVYLTGTVTPATIYSDSSNHTLTNPFRASVSGQWLFYAAIGQGYDVVMSSGLPPNAYTTPVTLTDLIVGSTTGAGFILEVNGTPISPASPGNLVDTATVTWAFTGGQIKATAVGSGGGCSSGGIATTNGLVTGDTTSTNCGLNNRTSDTATPPANVSTFGKANGAANSGTEAVMVGDTNGTSNAAVDVLFAGDTNGQDILSGNDWVGLGDFTFFGDATHTFVGQNNIAIGDQASATGSATGSHSLTDTIDIGDTAGLDTSGADYIYIGDSVGVHNLTGQDIVGIGNTAVANTVSGTDIVGIGNTASGNIGTGSNDVVGVGDGAADNLGAGVSDIVGIGDGASSHLGDASSSVVGIGLGAANEVSGQVVTNIVGIGQEEANVLGTASHDIIGIGNNGCTQLGVSSDDICIGDNVNTGSGTALVNSIGIGHGVTMVSNTTSIGNSSITSLILFGCPSGEAVLDDGSGTCFTPGGGGSVTWPTSSDLVISNGTNTPLGLAVVNGDCVIGSGGAWIAGSCGGSSGFPITLGSTSIAASSTTTTVAGLAIDGATATEIGFLSGVTSAIQTQLGGKQATGNYITALTGDGTASGPGSSAFTLATVNSHIGTCGDATHVGQVTLNAKGLTTGCTAVAITASSGISGGTANFIPLFGSSTTITANSHLDDGATTAATITSTEPIQIVSSGPSFVQIGTNVFSALPSCSSSTEGSISPVTDSTTNTWGATITGSGADHVMAYCDGTAWTVGAK